MSEHDIETTAGLIRSDPYAKALGIEFRLIEPGHAVCRMVLKPEHRNFMGSAHGGAIFSLADAAFSAAVNSSGFKGVAIHVGIDFLAPPGETAYLEADVREKSHAGRAGHYEMEVRNSAGEIVAVCLGWAYHTTKALG